MSEIMSEAQAQEALFASMQEDGNAPSQYGQEGAGTAPSNQAAEQALAAQREASQQTEQQGTPEGESTEAQTADAATEAFTRLDPNAIPEELKPWYHSMQADYTRKTQQVAELRKQYEGFDVDQAQAAMKFYDSLQDPQFAKSFYTQLGDTLTNLGYLEQQQLAQQAQQQELANAATQAQAYNDPEEFFAQKAAELEAKYASIEQRLEEQRHAAEQAQLYAALAGEVQRQESILRDANPHYTDSDLEAIYTMAGSDNNLLQAAERYEAAIADRVNRLISAKTSVGAAVGSPAPTGTAVEPPTFGDDLNAAHKAAQERLAQILAAENQ